MFRQIAFLLVGLCLMVGADASAQVKAGLNEINGSASLQGLKAEGSETFTVATFTGAYGRFIGDELEVGPQLSILKGEGSDATGTLDGFAALHFAPDATIVPYLGFQIGRGFGQSTPISDNPWNFGFFGGIKAFVGGSGALTVQPFWTRYTTRNPVIDDTSHSDRFGVSVGVSLFF